MNQPSERLQKVLAVGDTLALFPILKDWSTEELLALLKDADDWCDTMFETIDKAWNKAAFQPGIFLQKTMSESLDRARDEKKMKTTMVMSEICSVAMFFLHEHGVDVTYTIHGDGKAITCLLCGSTSHNENDVKNRYCVKCDIFHEDRRPAQ